MQHGHKNPTNNCAHGNKCTIILRCKRDTKTKQQRHLERSNNNKKKTHNTAEEVKQRAYTATWWILGLDLCLYWFVGLVRKMFNCSPIKCENTQTHARTGIRRQRQLSNSVLHAVHVLGEWCDKARRFYARQLSRPCCLLWFYVMLSWLASKFISLQFRWLKSIYVRIICRFVPQKRDEKKERERASLCCIDIVVHISANRISIFPQMRCDATAELYLFF